MVTKKQLDSIMKTMNPVIGFGLIVVILDLAAPLDYHLIFGAGLYTAIYIISRAIGKYSGAYFGASITHSPDTVKLYHYFSNKDELFMTCLGIVFTGLQSYIEEHKQSIRIEPAFEAIKSYYMLREDYFQLHPRQRPLFVNAVLRPPRQLADDISKLREPIKRLNRSFMNGVISKGNMRDGTDREYIASYLQIIEVYFWDMVSQFYSGDGDDKATMLFRAEKLLDMLLFGVLRS